MTISDQAFRLLPPAPEKCQQCAIEHPVDHPHDATTLYYGYFFYREHGRSPTWTDAMSHCSPELQAAWIEHLTSIDVDINSTNVKGGMNSAQELEQRLQLAGSPVIDRDNPS